MYLASTSREAALNAFAADCNSGTLNIYSGTQPATPDTAIDGGNTLLATLTFGSTAFQSATSGSTSSSITANAITSGTAGNTGAASFARLLSSGSVKLGDMTVGASSADLIINSTAIQTGATVACSSLTITMNE
jgi:hypothetical protein